MLLKVRDAKTRKFRYAIMACDRCKKPCEESRHEGPKVREAEIGALLRSRAAPGWSEVFVPAPPRVTRYQTTMETLCPECTLKAGVTPCD